VWLDGVKTEIGLASSLPLENYRAIEIYPHGGVRRRVTSGSMRAELCCSGRSLRVGKVLHSRLRCFAHCS
jgi:hypothetical protein